MISANLIPAKKLARKRCRSHLRVWIFICCVYGLLLLEGTVIGYGLWYRDDKALAGQVEALSQEIKNATRSIRDAQSRLAEAQAALAASREVRSQPDWSILLATLARQLRDEVVLNGCKLTPVKSGPPAEGGNTEPGASEPREAPLAQRNYQLTLSGLGRTQTAVSKFVLRLEHIDLFSEVRLTKSNRRPFLGGEAVAFRIDCSI